MKTSLLAVLALFATVSFSGYAFELGDMDVLALDGVHHAHHGGSGSHGSNPHGNPHANVACKKIKATDAQKAEIKATFQAMAKTMMALHKEMMEARKGYIQLVLTPSSDFVAADAATDKIQAVVNKAMDARAAAMNKIYFKILTAEQRKPALLCFSQKKHPHGNHHGNGHGHNPGHGGGHGLE